MGGETGIPLTVRASYTREEILPALGQSVIGGFMPGDFREGVKWCESIKTDALLITLEKDEKDFSPQTRYHDYALSETQFHWESQNQISESSPTGQRYQHHVTNGSHVLLFVRRYKTSDIGASQPWMLLGPASSRSHREQADGHHLAAQAQDPGGCLDVLDNQGRVTSQRFAYTFELSLEAHLRSV